MPLTTTEGETSTATLDICHVPVKKGYQNIANATKTQHHTRTDSSMSVERNDGCTTCAAAADVSSNEAMAFRSISCRSLSLAVRSSRSSSFGDAK